MTLSLITNQLQKDISQIIKNQPEDKWVSILKKADDKKKRGKKLSKVWKLVFLRADLQKNQEAREFVDKGYKWLEKHSKELSEKAKQRYKEIGPLYKETMKKAGAKDKPQEKPNVSSKDEKPVSSNLPPPQPEPESAKKIEEQTQADKDEIVDLTKIASKPRAAPSKAENEEDDEIEIVKVDVKPQVDAPLIPLRGITNIGNSCYMNSTLQALSRCPGILEMLKKKGIDAQVDSFRQYVADFIGELQKKEEVVSKEVAESFMDFLISKGWASKEKEFSPHDAYTFFEFLLNALQLDYKMYGVNVGKDSGSTAFSDLLLPEDLSAGRKRNLFLAKDKTCDLLVIAIENRFLSEVEKNKSAVRPVFSFDLPYYKDEAKKEHFELIAIIVNPSDFNRYGHYKTFAPFGDKSIEFNDSHVVIHDALNKSTQSQIEQHSYLYLYKRV